MWGLRIARRRRNKNEIGGNMGDENLNVFLFTVINYGDVHLLYSWGRIRKTTSTLST